MAKSWDWLAPRSFVRLPGVWKKGPARPCLPAVESLGDRVLLSAAPAAVVNQVLPGTCLVALVDGTIGQPGASDSVVQSEISIHKDMDKSSPVLFKAVDNEFDKLNGLLGALDGALILGAAGKDVQGAFDNAIDAEIIKINTLLGGGSPVGTPTADATTVLLPAVQDLANQVEGKDGLTQKFAALGTGASGVSIKIVAQYLALDAAFTDLENNLVNTSSDVILNPSNVPVDNIKIKIDEVLITALEPPDPAVQGPLQGAISEADSILSELLAPPAQGGGGSPTGAT